MITMKNDREDGLYKRKTHAWISQNIERITTIFIIHSRFRKERITKGTQVLKIIALKQLLLRYKVKCKCMLNANVNLVPMEIN